MRTIKKTILVAFAVVAVFAVLSPSVSADTDVDISVSTAENLTVSMYADAGGDIDFWIQGYNVEERFESLEECCDYLMEQTNINSDNIEEMRSYFNGHMNELYGRTEWLKDRYESNKDSINDVEDMVICRTKFLKRRQDQIMEKQDYLHSWIGDVEDTQEDIERRQDLQSHRMASLETSFHNRICALEQKLKDFIAYEHFEFFMLVLALTVITGYLAVTADQDKKDEKIKRGEYEEAIKDLKQENKELKAELKNVKEQLDMGDEN